MVSVKLKTAGMLADECLDVYDYGLTPEYYTKHFGGKSVQVTPKAGYMVLENGIRLPFRFADL